MALAIRDLQSADRAAWGRLWRDYLAFYKTEIPDAVYEAAFRRMIEGGAGEFRGLLALQDETPAGLAHYLFHRHGWQIADVCYLQDLFVAAPLRGRGVGKALIEAVYARADAAGAPAVYWLTQADNKTARRLYDKIALQTDFLKYKRRL